MIMSPDGTTRAATRSGMRQLRHEQNVQQALRAQATGRSLGLRTFTRADSPDNYTLRKRFNQLDTAYTLPRTHAAYWGGNFRPR